MLTRLKATLPKKNEILILSSENCFALKPLVEVIRIQTNNRNQFEYFRAYRFHSSVAVDLTSLFNGEKRY